VTALLGPRVLVRVEGLVALVAAVLLYSWQGGHWVLFAVLFLAPDLSMVGYVAGPRTGAATYNLVHTYVTPAVMGGLGLATHHRLVTFTALLVFAHIGFDRFLGYGLKYPNAFRDTHLQRL
jgi:uncharacterized protein DUF4260